MKRTISSELTFALKILLFTCLLAGWIVSILNLVLTFWGEPFYRFVLPLVIAIVIAFYWQLIQIKRVSIDEEYLYVSNYLNEIRLPIDSIGEVAEKDLANIRLVTIYLMVDSQFGRAINFLPKTFQASSVVHELREMVETQ